MLFLALICALLSISEGSPETLELLKWNEPSTNSTNQGDISIINGIASSFLMILSSEILDKSFFIAVVLAMRHSRLEMLIVYAGAVSALSLMTVLSVTVGMLTSFIPQYITIYASAALMFAFAIKMFFDAYQMSSRKGQKDLKEVQRKFEERSDDSENDLLLRDEEEELPSRVSLLKMYAEAFALTFLAEWGDRSQVATVLLAATENTVGVLIGGVAGHALSTAVAVLGGRAVAECITVRVVTIIGGVIFLIFSVLAVVWGTD